jgi:hypothetical protein
MRRVTAIAVLPVVALTLVGLSCSSDDTASEDTTTTSTTPASTTSTTAATTTSTAAGATSSTTTAGTPACTAGELQGELGPSDAGAGQVYAPVIVRNTGSTTCEVTGFPGVSVLDGSGAQIGAPATRDGAEGGSVLLPPGGVASATLHTTSEGIGGSCEPRSAQMKVYPPNQTAAITFTAAYTVCGGFSVTTMVPGDTGLA